VLQDPTPPAAVHKPRSPNDKGMRRFRQNNDPASQLGITAIMVAVSVAEFKTPGERVSNESDNLS